MHAKGLQDELMLNQSILHCEQAARCKTSKSFSPGDAMDPPGPLLQNLANDVDGLLIDPYKHDHMIS
jgi:hypothetical protein